MKGTNTIRTNTKDTIMPGKPSSSNKNSIVTKTVKTTKPIIIIAALTTKFLKKKLILSCTANFVLA